MYPKVMTEFETLQEALCGTSLARFGDGELRLCHGSNCPPQKADPRLTIELRDILIKRQPGLLPCIPHLTGPKSESWKKYASVTYTRFYQQPVYGSAFITRPDSAPWINNPGYWQAVASLWRDKDVVIVRGDRKSITQELIGEAPRSVREVIGRSRDSYEIIDQIEEEVGKPSGTVLICLGPTATVLAARLARKGVHAVDLGHIGMFMRRLGVSTVTLEDLVSSEYQDVLRKTHQRERWGNAGKSHVDEVLALASRVDAKDILDYGCGTGSLKTALRSAGFDIPVQEFDPGIPDKDTMPRPADLIVCTDVLEHVEESRIDLTLSHIRNLMRKGAYFIIAMNKAKLTLPDGRNAHLLQKPAEWWVSRLKKYDFPIARHEVRKGLNVWCIK